MRKTKFALGAVVADREFKWHSGERRGNLTVQIGRPRRDARPGGDWFCPVQFSGVPRGGGLPTAVTPVFGVDRLQALTLALGYVQLLLAHVSAELALTWLDSTDLGLPDIVGLLGVRRSFRRPPRRRSQPKI